MPVELTRLLSSEPRQASRQGQMLVRITGSGSNAPGHVPARLASAFKASNHAERSGLGG